MPQIAFMTSCAPFLPSGCTSSRIPVQLARMVSNGSDDTERPAGASQEAREPLLRTKLFIPPIRLKRVARPGLIQRIQDNLDTSLVLVSAPAGFGKTTLLAEWAAQAGMPVAWLSLDAGDNDPRRFLAYVIAALNRPFKDAPVCTAARAMLESFQSPPFQTILFTFINDLTEISQPLALVLDDYQFITSQGVNEVLTAMLEHIPADLHLVISTRLDPSLPLHRLRARQQMIEVRADDLRFTRGEAGAFLNTVMDLNLSEADIFSLSERTEGWVVGLQMAALSMPPGSDHSAFVRAFGGSQRYILEYLIEEVLERQPEDIQAFLLRTSILDRLCGPLCDAVLGSQGSSVVLERLERSNLFLTQLDETGYWYRYHHLFADLLRARLLQSHPEELQSLHLRASRWYEEAGIPEQAIQHALAAGEIARAARLVERSAFDIMSRGEMASLLGLFDALPEELISSRAGLGIYRAWAFIFSGQLQQVEPQLLEVEKIVQPDDGPGNVREILGSIAVIRGLLADFQGNMASAIEFARQADRLLPSDKWAERSIIPYVLGDGYMSTGELDKAAQAFEEIGEVGKVSGNLWTVSVALHKLALVKKLQGKLHAVNDLYQETIRFASQRGGQHYGSLGASYVGLSDLLREWNELDAARQVVTQAVKDMERWRSPTDLVNGYITLARISLSSGEIDIARRALERAEDIGRTGNIFLITRKTLEACQVRMDLHQGDLDQAERWVKDQQLNEKWAAGGWQLDFVNEVVWISLGRVLIAQKEWDRALDVLATLAEAAESAGRQGRLIEILALLALALNGSGRVSEAHGTLAKSLALAEPEGYMRLFLDEGKPMQALLRACSRSLEGSLTAYADRLLEAFALEPRRESGEAAQSFPSETLVEPLTGREVEVLRLLAAGLSNQEIAERLYLSAGTVKTHTHNLYGKLGVRTRTQAIARAQELKLI